MNRKNWPQRPKSLSERGYRKYMAKTKKVTVNGHEFELQSVSPSWYYDFNDECGNTGSGKRKSAKYMDGMFKNCVISPPEVKAQGMEYFDARRSKPSSCIWKNGSRRRGRKQKADSSSRIFRGLLLFPRR